MKNENDISLKRLILLKKDLIEAKKYGNAILDRCLHLRKDPNSKLEHQAFDIALVVSYARVFKRRSIRPGNASDSG